MWSANALLPVQLSQDQDERFTTDMALKHPWVTGEKASKSHNSQMISTLKEFNARRKFQQGVGKIMVVNRFTKPAVEKKRKESVGHAEIHETHGEHL